MHETQEDIHALQGLLDQSVGQAAAFLRASMQLDIQTLNARAVCAGWR